MNTALFLMLPVMALGALLVVLARPALKRTPPVSDDGLAAALREGLARIDAAEAQGHFDAVEADSARDALRRAILAQLDQAARSPVSRSARFGALVYLGLAPVAAFALYWQIGAPAARLAAPRASSDSVDAAAALAALPPDARDAQIRAMVDGLAARLDDNPGDLDGLRRLARAQTVLGRYDDARGTFARLFAQIPGDVDDWRAYAGLFVAEAGAGTFPVVPEFLRALGELETRVPDDGFVLFFRGGAARANGDVAAALAAWRKLLATIPEAEPARTRLEALIRETEGARPPDRVSPKIGGQKSGQP